MLKSICIEQNRSGGLPPTLGSPKSITCKLFGGKEKPTIKQINFELFKILKPKGCALTLSGIPIALWNWRENIVNLSVSVKSADFIGLLRTKFNNCFSLMLYTASKPSLLLKIAIKLQFVSLFILLFLSPKIHASEHFRGPRNFLKSRSTSQNH